MKQYKTIKKEPLEIFNFLCFDAVICASGFEKRSIFLIENYKIDSKRKIALFFDDNTKALNRPVNDSFFKNRGFETLTVNGDDHIEIFKMLESIDYPANKNINILIDYSSMTRVWYAAILSFFKDKKSSSSITLYLSYSKPTFQEPPQKDIPNTHVGPIMGYSNLSISNKPTALIIGLGYEKIRAYGLTDYLDAETYLFYNSSISGNEYSICVEKNNEDLIRSVGEEKVFIYNFDDVEYTFFILYNLCKKLSNTHRVVLAPCGAKPFTIYCLLIAHILPNVNVWRISPGKKRIPIDSIPNGEVLLFRTDLFDNKE